MVEMKTLELSLPTPVLLVWGLPEDAKLIEVRPHQIRNAVHEEDCYAAFSGDTYLFRSPLKIEFVGKLWNLTEEQAKRLVMAWRVTALESFHSAIEAEGRFVVNPIGEKPEMIW